MIICALTVLNRLTRFLHSEHVSANVNPIVLILSAKELDETVQIVDYELLGCRGVDGNLVGLAVFAFPFTYSDT